MRRPQFSLKGMLLAIAAISPLIAVGPPYRFTEIPCLRHAGFNADFWTVAGIELAIVVWISLLRYADSLRREYSENE